MSWLLKIPGVQSVVRSIALRIVSDTLASELRRVPGLPDACAAYLRGGTPDVILAAYVVTSASVADNKALKMVDGIVNRFRNQPVRMQVEALGAPLLGMPVVDVIDTVAKAVAP